MWFCIGVIVGCLHHFAVEYTLNPPQHGETRFHGVDDIMGSVYQKEYDEVLVIQRGEYTDIFSWGFFWLFHYLVLTKDDEGNYKIDKEYSYER